MADKAVRSRVGSSLPVLLAVAGFMAWWWRAPPLLVAIPLLLAPGWGLTRLLSVADRRFGLLGSSLCLSLLVLGVLPRLTFLPSAQLPIITHALTLGLCLAGAARQRMHLAWQARQPPHPDPMLLWPAHVWMCLIVLGTALGALAFVQPLDDAVLTAPRAEQTALAYGWQWGEDPFLAGHAPPAASLPASAAATLSAASGCHPLVVLQLIASACLVATLLFLAEGISRLWGNRGASRAMLAFLLGLNPLALFFMAGAEDPMAAMAPGFDPGITTALHPFLLEARLPATLAFVAMMLSCTLSILRRGSTHIPRLLAAASCGLALTRPEAVGLLLPGWVLGTLLSHWACRGHPDNDPHPNNRARRAGEPTALRSPFWRPVLHLVTGLGVALLIAPDLAATLTVPPASAPRVVAWALLAAVGPTCLLFMPGIRHLNASPGREAFFFVGLVVVTVASSVVLDWFGDRGNEAVRLLSLLLAVPCANGALKMIEIHGGRARLLLAMLVLGCLSAPMTVLRETAQQQPRVSLEQDGRGGQRVMAEGLDAEWLAGLREAAEFMPESAVLTADWDSAGDSGHAVAVLISGRPWLAAVSNTSAQTGVNARLTPDAARAAEERHALVDRLGRGDGTALAELRAIPELASRETWSLNRDGWPGFRDVKLSGSLRLQRARTPHVVLVTVSALRADQIATETMPFLADTAQNGLVFRTTVTPHPARVAALRLILAEPEDTPSLPQAFASRGYRLGAALSLAPSDLTALGKPLADGFETLLADASLDVEQIVDEGLARLADADPRPLFLWLHLEDLTLPWRRPAHASLPDNGLSEFPSHPDLERMHFGVAPRPRPAERTPPRADRPAWIVDEQVGRARYAALVAEVDTALARLASALGPEHLLVVTAPYGLSLGEHDAWFDHGRDLFEPSIRVPLVLAGAGMPEMDTDRLTSLVDIPALLTHGALPTRERVELVGRPRPGAGGSGAWPPAMDPTSRGPAGALLGERTATHKTVLVRPPGAPGGPLGLRFDLRADAGEMDPTAADAEALDRLAKRVESGAEIP